MKLLKTAATFLCLICLYFFWKSLSSTGPQPDLSVIGFVNMRDGLGRQSVELMQCLKDEMLVNFISTGKIRLNDTPADLHSMISSGKKDAQMGKVMIYESPLSMLSHGKRRILTKLSKAKGIKIAYSMFESSRIPDEWVAVLNQYFDAVAVPDKFLISVYRDSGVTIPVFELPLGLYLTDFLKEPLKKERNKPMVFGNFSTLIDRKNQEMLIHAFVEAFKNSPDVMLRLNSRESHNSKLIKKMIQDAKATNIIFTQERLVKEDYLTLFKSVDCYVSLSKGEGFSIQPREAMALGIPTIVTNNTGQTTICESGLVEAVPSEIVAPAYYEWSSYHGDSYNCKIEDAVSALQKMYYNYETYLKNAEKARKWASQYQYSNLKPLYKCLIKPKKVVLSSENRLHEDYLETNSQELFEKYQSLLEDSPGLKAS